MASLPPIRKLYLEDFPSQKTWISPFLLTMNQFMTTVVTALSKGITLVDNTTSDIKYITLNSVPTADAPASVAWTKTQIPIAVLVGNIQTTSGTPVLTNAVQIQWAMSSSNSSLQITNVIGITPSDTEKYVLTLVCIAG